LHALTDHIAHHPFKHLLALGSRDGRVFLIDSQTFDDIKTIKVSQEGISALTFTVHGNYLLCGCDNGELKIYRTDNFSLHKSYEHHQ